MSVVTGLTRGGAAWTPVFIVSVKQSNCIGCGRCFKVCPRDVFELVDREDIEGLDDPDDEMDEDDGFSDDTSMVMSLKDMLDCIGCQACSRVCAKKCLTHEPQPVAA